MPFVPTPELAFRIDTKHQTRWRKKQATVTLYHRSGHYLGTIYDENLLLAVPPNCPIT